MLCLYVLFFSFSQILRLKIVEFVQNFDSVFEICALFWPWIDNVVGYMGEKCRICVDRREYKKGWFFGY